MTWKTPRTHASCGLIADLIFLWHEELDFSSSRLFVPKPESLKCSGDI